MGINELDRRGHSSVYLVETMDYSHFMICSFLGGGPALAIFFSLRAKRRANIPSLAWWFSAGLGTIFFFYGLSHSTVPSLARRVTAVGKASNYMERIVSTGYHHDTIYGFRFVPDGGNPIDIETEISLPDAATPRIFNGQTFRVVYLDDNNRTLKNEGIDITITSGTNAGFRDALDARPAGKWLAIPIGTALGIFGFLGLKYLNADEISAASGDNDPLPT